MKNHEKSEALKIKRILTKHHKIDRAIVISLPNLSKLIDEMAELKSKQSYNLGVLDSAIAMQIYGDIVDENILLRLLKQ